MSVPSPRAEDVGDRRAPRRETFLAHDVGGWGALRGGGAVLVDAATKIEFADELDGLSLLGQKPMVFSIRSDGSKSISFIPCVI